MGRREHAPANLTVQFPDRTNVRSTDLFAGLSWPFAYPAGHGVFPLALLSRPVCEYWLDVMNLVWV
jgi:hypothetical protein